MPPAATAAASALVPALKLTLLPASATASASAPAPTVTTSSGAATLSTHALYAYPSITATSAEAQSGGTGYLSGSSNSTPLAPSTSLAPNPTLAPQSDESIILNAKAVESQTGATGRVLVGASGAVSL